MVLAPNHVADSLARQLAVQAGTLTAGQAVQHFTAGFVRAQLAGRRWQRPHRGVLVLHNGPLSERQQLWVAVLAAAPGSVLGGLTALVEDGLTTLTPDHIDIVMPPSARRPSRDGAQYRWSTRLEPVDVHPWRTPHRTRPARSAIDAASWSRRAARGRVIVLATVQQRLTRPDDLYAALARRGNVRRRALILESIHDAGGGIQSLPERDFDLIRRRIRAPEPSRQSVTRRADGRFYLDVEWRSYGARCEIHGIPHSWAAQWDADIDRSNEITLQGPRLLIFTSYAIRRSPERVGDQLTRLLERGGW